MGMADTVLVTAAFTEDTVTDTVGTEATHKAEPLMQQPILAVAILVAMVEALSKTTLFFLV
jgi:hypothetical protein